MMKKKEVVLAMFAMFGLAAESSASAGLGVSTGLGASTGLSVSASPGASINSGAYASSITSTNLGASSGSGASTDIGVSTDAGASVGIGTSTGETSTGLGTDLEISDDLGVSTGLGVSTDLGTSSAAGVFAGTSGLTALGATVDAVATRPMPATTKVTLDSPALNVTSEVVAAQAANSTSTITVGAPAVPTIIERDVETPKLSLTADVDASTSPEIGALVSSVAATVNPVLSDKLADTAQVGGDIAGQSTGTFDLSATAGVENIHPLHSKLATGADAVVSTVPEADTYAMLLAGLGLMGFMVNRRKEQLK